MAKNILDLLFWHPNKEIDNTIISYIHRGATGNIKTITGDEIKRIEKGFLVLQDDIYIPLHRIIKIEYNQNLVWKKSPRNKHH